MGGRLTYDLLKTLSLSKLKRMGFSEKQILNKLSKLYLREQRQLIVNENTKNIDNLSSDDNFRLTTKIVNSKSNDKRGLEFVVFDIVPIEDYYIGKSVIPYKERLELMEELIGEGNEFVRLVEKFGVTDNVEEIYNQLEKVIADNQEGIILNTLDGVYGFGKRSKEIF